MSDFMTDSAKAARVIEVLKSAEREPPQLALSLLNGLTKLMPAEQEQPMEIEEARATAFLTVCDLAKALHRGQPASHLWTSAIDAAERWSRLVG
jgi:hypothetical protein